MELKSPEQHIQEHLEQIIELMVAREKTHGKPDSAFTQTGSLSFIFGPEQKSADELRKAEIAALSGYIQSAFSAIEYNLEAIAQQQITDFRPEAKRTMAADWQPFDCRDFECGLFWLLVESPDVDIDADDDGRTVGRYTGDVVRSAVLAMVEEGDEGLPYFEAIDSANFGRIADDDVVTHFAEVKAPDIPANR